MKIASELFDIQKNLSYLILKDGLNFINVRLSIRLNQSSCRLISMTWDFNEVYKNEIDKIIIGNKEIDFYLISALKEQGFDPEDIELSIFIGNSEIPENIFLKFKKTHKTVYQRKSILEKIKMNIQILTI